MTDLSGFWTLSDESGAHSIPFALPGDAISALHAAGVIPDPYWGRNEYDLRWICGRDWVARVQSEMTELPRVMAARFALYVRPGLAPGLMRIVKLPLSLSCIIRHLRPASPGWIRIPRNLGFSALATRLRVIQI